uniref:Uncharacterized protein n=1 Tax=Macrostomum lignano TaxID=282301 RepID=A0A1I8FEE2_9PLAT
MAKKDTGVVWLGTTPIAARRRCRRRHWIRRQREEALDLGARRTATVATDRCCPGAHEPGFTTGPRIAARHWLYPALEEHHLTGPTCRPHLISACAKRSLTLKVQLLLSAHAEITWRLRMLRKEPYDFAVTGGASGPC